jgi:hypothetical protein
VLGGTVDLGDDRGVRLVLDIDDVDGVRSAGASLRRRTVRDADRRVRHDEDLAVAVDVFTGELPLLGHRDEARHLRVERIGNVPDHDLVLVVHVEPLADQAAPDTVLRQWDVAHMFDVVGGEPARRRPTRCGRTDERACSDGRGDQDR